MLKVKVCGLNDPENIQEISGLVPDFMGFIFYPGSVRFAGNKLDSSFTDNIPSGILKTGVFVNEEPSRVTDTVKKYKLDLIQLHGVESAEYCDILNKQGLDIIKVFNVSGEFSFDISGQYLRSCKYFLFDTKTDIPGGSGIKFDWRRINDYRFDKPFFIGGGIGPDDAELILNISHKSLFAVDINSRFEISPGIKNYDQVKGFIKKIKR